MAALKLLGFAAASAMLTAEPALAQTVASLSDETVARGLSGSVANGPNDSFLKSSGAPDIQLLASSDEKVASLSVSIGLRGSSRPGILSANQLTLSASGKLDGDGDARLVGLKGFSNGTELTFAYTHFGGRYHLTGDLPTPVLAAEKNCRELRGNVPACLADEYPTGASDFVAKYYPQASVELVDQVMRGPIHFWGIEGSGNQASYKFLQRSTFSVKNESHFGFGGSVFAGLLLNRGQTAVTAAYTYNRTWDEQGSVTLCQPLVSTTQSQCITSQDGAPTRTNQSIVSFELRHAFPVAPGSFPTLAIAPEVSVATDHDAYSISVPVYFAGDGTGKLRGGVRGVYVNEKGAAGGRDDDFTVALFVGVPFSAFGR